MESLGTRLKQGVKFRMFEGEVSRSAVLMISPIPEVGLVLQDGQHRKRLEGVVPGLVPRQHQQLRVVSLRMMSLDDYAEIAGNWNVV